MRKVINSYRHTHTHTHTLDMRNTSVTTSDSILIHFHYPPCRPQRARCLSKLQQFMCDACCRTSPRTSVYRQLHETIGMWIGTAPTIRGVPPVRQELKPCTRTIQILARRSYLPTTTRDRARILFPLIPNPQLLTEDADWCT
jgi:hypothetical protein